jgi:hypothetical protein
MTDLFFIFVLILPLTAPVAFAVAVGVLVRRAAKTGWRMRSWTTPGTLLLASFAGACAALSAFAYGWVWVPGIWMDPDDLCSLQGFAGDRVVRQMFPMSVRCVPVGSGEDGELVPWWVNPTLVLGLLTCVAALGGAVRVATTVKTDRTVRA